MTAYKYGQATESQSLDMPQTIWIALSVILVGTLITIGLITFIRDHQRLKNYEREVRCEVARLRRTYPEYIYAPLRESSSKTIRLIELLPSDVEDEAANGITIHIKLRTSSLEDTDAQAYEAISYCWGDTTLQSALVCDDAIILVTESLWFALYRLRLRGQNRLLWADAICINQLDLIEKSWQVRMMSNIYQTATQVLIYLGEEAKNSELLEDFLPLLAGAKESIADELANGTLSDTSRLSKERQKQLGIRSLGIGNGNIFEFAAMQDVLLRAWFGRVWIIQEVALATDATVLCGNWEMPWSTFLAAYEVADVLPISGAELIFMGRNCVKSLSLVQECARGARADMIRLLILHRGAKATNPVDHVFALLSLAEDGQEFEVDYRKSVSQVFEDTARHILLSSRELVVLNAVGSSQRMDPTLPSWVPDWRVHLISVPLFIKYEELAKLQVETEICCDGTKLGLKGFKIDTVVLMGCCAPILPKEPTFRYWHEIQCLAVYGQWLNTIKPFSTNAYQLTGESVLDVFWQILTEYDTSAYMDMVKLQHFEYLFSIARLVNCLPIPFTSSPLSYRAAIFQGFGFLLFVILLQPRLVYHRFMYGKQIEPVYAAENCKGRRMVKTDSGYIGIAPRDTEVGDHVFLLQGGFTPFVLRSLGKKDEYALIGECLIHGFMEKLAGDVGECHPIRLV